MCGLVGIAGDLRLADEFTMKRLFLADYFRGPDSTGLAAIRTNGEIVVSKLASNPIDLFDMSSFKTALNGNNSRAFIGHNRQKTRGSISTANAHPFHVDHIVGAHNGTLDYQSVKRLETELGETFEVDSLALITAFAKLGAEKAIKLCTEGKTSTDGAWALSWFDKQEGTLNFLRNKHRPLFYCHMKVGEEDKYTRLMWASEWWMLREAIASSVNGKYNLFTKKENDSNIGYFSLDADVHYKFDLAELKAGSEKPLKPKVKKLKGREPETVSYVPFTGDSLSKPWPKETTGTSTTGVGSPNSKGFLPTLNRGNNDSKKKVIELIGEPIKHPYANIVDEDKFKSFADGQGGTKCCYCTKPVEFGDKGISIFEKNGKFLCKECTGYPEEHPNAPIRVYVRPSVFAILS